MTEWFQSWLPHLQDLGIAGNWLLLLATFGESFVLTGMFVPGTVLLIVMGGLIPQGYYDFRELALYAIVGSIIGDAVSFELGKVGRFHVERFRAVHAYMKRGKEFFDRHGTASVFMGRFIGPIRPIVPFIAGVSDMKRLPYYLCNITSAIGWSVTYLLLGYAFGYAWKAALAWSSAAVTAVVMVVLAVVFIRWYRRPKRQIILGDV
jgi:membrane protein DedA with SNARE-associated domain